MHVQRTEHSCRPHPLERACKAEYSVSTSSKLSNYESDDFNDVFAVGVNSIDETVASEAQIQTAKQDHGPHIQTGDLHDQVMLEVPLPG